MNPFLKILVVLAMILFLHAGTGYTDTVLLRNGDKLIGDVQNKYFMVKGSFGRIAVEKSFCKNIIMVNSQLLIGSLKTINNDLFTGTILNEKVQILHPNETLETVNINDLKSLFLSFSGPSRQVITTIFKTQDGDRFSGKLLNPEIKIRTAYMTAIYQDAEINRIEFNADAPDNARLLLTNGEVIHGNLLWDKIMIEPDSCAQLTVDQSKLSSIQFNAPKMLLNEYNSSAAAIKDGDRDGVPDDVDSCGDTPWGVQVDENGCSTDKIAAKIFDKAAKTSIEPQDNDADSVIDGVDQCPRTPAGAKVDKNGCWSIQDILFDFDSARLKSEFYTVLNEVSVVLQKNPSTKIEIRGGTDNIGPEAYNRILSQRRAQHAKNYLIGKGIEAERILAVGYGTAGNKASNANSAGRALNRRIDFMVIE
jgi:OOP family OmpA-OmpF porin